MSGLDHDPLPTNGAPAGAPFVLTAAVEAMRCRFELVLVTTDESLARTAAEDAIREIERLDSVLSPFRAGSDIAHLNAVAAQQAVPVTVEIMALLELCRELSQATGGCFDPTVGPLLSAWGFRGSTPAAPPDSSLLAELRRGVGLHLIELDAAERTVRFGHPLVRLDLGAVGKGWAVDEAARIVAGYGLHGLIHAGTSSVHAVGATPDGAPWTVAVGLPAEVAGPAPVASLRDSSLGVSGRSGRLVTIAGRAYGHVIDPRSGEPVTGARLAAVQAPTAAVADAWSTALLVGGTPLAERMAHQQPGLAAWLLPADSAERPWTRGSWATREPL